jgi:hypothetical protein
MRWVTLSCVHLDRVASPWLVRRFVDPQATFEFIEWGLDGKPPTAESIVAPTDATPLGLPGAKLGLHDEHGSCFSKVLRAYELDDPALWRMERLVASGISHAIGTPPPSAETNEERTLGAALDIIGGSFGIAFDDAQHLESAFPLYDAIYQHCQTLDLSSETFAAAPRLPPQRIPYLRDAIARMRAEREQAQR